jgi:predicted Zn-dependent protease
MVGMNGTWRLNSLALLVFALLAFAGCSSSHDELSAFTAPPAPTAGVTPFERFFVQTENYFTTQAAPFDPSVQFANVHYPVPVAYQLPQDVVPPATFKSLVEESEDAIRNWAAADPRVTVVSGVTPNTTERIHITLANSIEYQGLQGILGLTMLTSGANDPRYYITIAVLDPYTQQPLTVNEVRKTLLHELGHALGLGHSPDERDLMHAKANSKQGDVPLKFLTFGDALTIWTTLNNRRIDWVQSRPIITTAQPSVRITSAPEVRIAEDDGEVVCIYTR